MALVFIYTGQLLTPTARSIRPYRSAPCLTYAYVSLACYATVFSPQRDATGLESGLILQQAGQDEMGQAMAMQENKWKLCSQYRLPLGQMHQVRGPYGIGLVRQSRILSPGCRW